MILRACRADHLWRFVFYQHPRGGLWQCERCARLEAGREPTPEEAARRATFEGKEAPR